MKGLGEYNDLLIVILAVLLAVLIVVVEEDRIKEEMEVYSIPNKEVIIPNQDSVVEDATKIGTNDSIKSELTSQVSKYIHKIAPQSDLNAELLVDKCIEYEINPAFVLAQGHLESHFGTKGLAKQTNSVWNVCAYNGFDFSRISSNGKYSSPDDSIEPYLHLIKNKYSGGSGTDKLLKKFVSVDGHRYASSETYESRLRSIHNKILSGTKISDLYNEIIKGVAI